MRSVSSVILFLVFLLSQYGRNLAYLECTLYNLVQQGTGIRCDCEKMTQQSESSDTAATTPVQKQGGVHLDEGFTPAVALETDMTVWQQGGINTFHWNERVLTGFGHPAFHPPPVVVLFS
jgi:hypothetical protein